MLPDSPEALYSYHSILDHSVAVDCLEIFQAYETYTTRSKMLLPLVSVSSVVTPNRSDLGGARYLLAIGNDFTARFYRLSINGHEIFLRELGLAVSFEREPSGWVCDLH